jgi:hypothetical protein
MKRFVAAALGAIGVGAFLRRRRQHALPAPVAPENTLADELRAKLAASRAAEAEVTPEPSPESELEARRRAVHERAKQSIDELS